MRVELHCCDVLEGLRSLPDESVHTCITSPPYWGLRDYGHEGQIGLEASLGEYIGKLVTVFDEVRRVLRPDGTLWLNMGDAYAGSWGAQGRQGETGQMAGRSVVAARDAGISARQIEAHPQTVTRTGALDKTPGLKQKDLMGIPWRLAFALQDAGWYLRQDIIWHKPNPMPESVRDRCTKAHEYLFLLSKSARYYFDQEAMKEPASFGEPNSPQSIKSPHGQGYTRRSGNKERKPASARGCPEGTGSNVAGSVPWEGGSRNKRSVWSVSTVPFPGAHFATFPPKLIEPCVLAGSPPDGVVLDPFTGSGTTGAVALEHGRRFVGIELNPEYMAMAQERCEDAQRQSRLFA